MIDTLPDHIKSKIEIDPDRGCWLWQGEINRNGYGRLWYNGSRYMCHIFMYQISTQGKDWSHLYHDHLCEVRNCCNPAHIEPVTQKVNCKRIYRRRVYVDPKGNVIRPKGKKKS